MAKDMKCGYCRDCKWWIKDSWFDPGTGMCDLTNRNEGEMDHPDTLAWGYDTEGYHAHLVTKDVFGCVQFEENEPTPQAP